MAKLFRCFSFVSCSFIGMFKECRCFYFVSGSSIGMAKAALEAVNGCNLFGEAGAAWSVIFVDIDAHNRNRTIFETILPRESNSKVNIG